MLPVGECRLCLQTSELEASHIIPRWVYRRLSHAAGRHGRTVEVTPEDQAYTQNQPKEHMLCGTCEDRVGKWEGRVADLAFQLDGSFPLRDSLGTKTLLETRPISHADASSLARFAMSVFWRAHITTHPRFAEIRLGRFGEMLRRWLLFDDVSRVDAAWLFVGAVAPDPIAGEVGCNIMKEPSRVPADDQGFHFMFHGLHCVLLIGAGYVGRTYRDFCIMRSRSVVLVDADLILGEIVRDLKTSTPRGAWVTDRARRA